MGKIKRIKAARKRAEVEQKIKKTQNRKSIFKYALLLLLVAGLGYGSYLIYQKYKTQNSSSKTENKTEARKTYTEAPKMQIDSKKKYTAKMETTKGEITLELFADKAPITVSNFVALTGDNFYNDIKFHRIVKDFMIQTGDPEGTGAGGPGYKFDDEKFEGDYTPGTVAMANSGANTNGSQFFIMTGDYSGGKLPKNYVIFGKVTSGMDVVQKIAETPTEDNGQGEKSKPLEEVKIIKITIEEK